MLTAVVTVAGDSLVSLHLQSTPTEPPAAEEAATDAAGAATETNTEADAGPSPITPELKELAWGAGAFIVLAVVMRYVLFPRLREGMHARYESIQQGFTDADALRDAARTEVADYDKALASVKAEAKGRIDAARETLDAERQARLADVNTGIAERRARAVADAEAAREAASGQVGDAVGTVASRVVQMVTGNEPSGDAVRSAVGAVSNGERS